MSLACAQRRLQWEVLSPHEMDGSPQDLPVLLVYGSRDPVTENDLGAHSADQIEARQGWCDSAAFCRHVFNHSPLDMSKQLWQSLHGESERNDSKQSQQSQHSKHSKGIPKAFRRHSKAFESIPKHSKQPSSAIEVRPQAQMKAAGRSITKRICYVGARHEILLARGCGESAA